MKNLYVFAIGLLVALIIWATLTVRDWVQLESIPVQESISSEAVATSVRNTFELITHKVYMENLYYHYQSDGYRYLPDTWTDKQVVIKVQGEFSVGWKMDSLLIDIVDSTKTMVMHDPQPEILSQDLKTNFMYMEDSYLNEFEYHELNNIKAAYRDSLVEDFLQSRQYMEVREQLKENAKQIEQLVQSYGWNLVIKHQNTLLQ
jgi:hypothetical protein